MTPDRLQRARSALLAEWLLTMGIACSRDTTTDAGTHAPDVPTADAAPVDVVNDVVTDGGADALDAQTTDMALVDATHGSTTDSGVDALSTRDVPPQDAAVLDVTHDVAAEICDAAPGMPCVLPDGRVPDLQNDPWSCGGGIHCCSRWCSSG